MARFFLSLLRNRFVLTLSSLVLFLFRFCFLFLFLFNSLPLSSSLFLSLPLSHSLTSYTHSNTDCWDALSVLDVSPTDPNSVTLIYKRTDELITQSGSPDGWNREHVWPKSYGVGYDGPDTVDLHSLRASDWSVNSCRSNRYYDWCTATTPGCISPAHHEVAHLAADETGRKTPPGELGFFMPPSAVRGDLARSVFYMATRYDGEEDGTEDLAVSDCPCLSSATMGKLSTLLEWHRNDPPDAAEIERTNRLCMDYQGNRNPYIDHPDLAEAVFGGIDTNAACPVCPEVRAKRTRDKETERGESESGI